MEKFSLEFKKVVSEKYLEGELSLKSVARMYGISPCTVRKLSTTDEKWFFRNLGGRKWMKLNRPGFPGECFICELRLPDHRFRWKH
ncbi:hypothetical protein OSL02_24615, partial [Escherichia coli]|nr:hypothetical protein [Escherichia coli]